MAFSKDLPGFATRAIHAGQPPDPETGARAMPIYATSSFVFEDAQSAADLFRAPELRGHLTPGSATPPPPPSRSGSPPLKGGWGGWPPLRGQAAQLIAVLTLCQEGDEIVAARNLYGGTITQFDVTLRRMGIHTTFVDASRLENVEEAITDRTRLVYGETIGNPRGEVLDIEPIAEIAHSHGIPLMLDNTFASPWLCRPFEWGADIVSTPPPSSSAAMGW